MKRSAPVPEAIYRMPGQTWYERLGLYPRSARWRVALGTLAGVTTAESVVLGRAVWRDLFVRGTLPIFGLVMLAIGVVYVGQYIVAGWAHWGSYPWVKYWSHRYITLGRGGVFWFRWGRCLVALFGLVAGLVWISL